MKAMFPFWAKAAARRSGWIPASTFQSVCGLPAQALVERRDRILPIGAAADHNLADIFESVADALPERTALIQGDRVVTWAEFDARSDALAAHFIASGMGQDAFLKMFMAQMTNQNPLDPMDNTQFTAQLAGVNLADLDAKVVTTQVERLRAPRADVSAARRHGRAAHARSLRCRSGATRKSG